jgi:predicted DNA-binding transcriptional regulator YafY
LELTDVAIDRQNLEAEIPDEIFGNASGGETVKITADISAREIFTNFPTNAPPVKIGSTLSGEIRIGNLKHLGRHVARYGGLVQVLAPDEARAVVKQCVEQALSEPIQE